jgi:ectoine hydroxylase-related dioxygenase (phytanoyl-CoA dioxygenase family)
MKNTKNAKQLDENGFDIIPNLLNKEEIKEIRELFFELNLGFNADFYTTHWLKKNEKQSVHNSLEDKLKKKINKSFPNFESILFYYLVKNNKSNTRVTPHQDWTIIDNETNEEAFTLWIPLEDTNKINGGLRVVPKSHNILTEVRGSDIQAPYNDIAEYVDTKYGQDIDTKNGDAIIFNHKLLHSSHPNLSNSLRLAIGVVLIPKNSQCVHYYYEKNQIHKFRV